MKKSQFLPLRLEILCSSLVILCVIKPTYPAAHDGATDLIAATRCRARCLANLDIYLRELDSSGIKNYDPDKANVLKTCFMDRTCAACSRPCDLISRLDEVDCTEWCQEDEDDCLATCGFLEEIGSTPKNPGSCPAPGATSAVCINACKTDRDCDADTQGLKCCSNGCGTSCQKPVSINFQSFPPKPQKIKVSSKKKKGSRTAQIKWSVKSTNFATNPTVYIVQYKHHASQHFKKAAMPKEWDNTVLVVNGREVTIREMELGHWYVFRVAAVDTRGSAGFVNCPVPFRLQTEPTAPSPPYNLTAVESMVRDGKHFVKIRWDAPRETDLPISKYKIFWNKQTDGLKKVVTRKNKDGKKTIAGKNQEFVLKNLEGSTVYLVQVQAVIQFGARKLRSKKTHVVISTHGSKVASAQRLVDESSSSESATAAGTPITWPKFDAGGEKLIDAVLDLDLESPLPAPVENLTAASPYFQNGLVKVDLSWNKPNDNGATRQFLMHWVPDICIGGTLDSLMTKPVSATTDGNRFTVFDMRFDCRYDIQVQGVSASGKRGPISSVGVNVLGCKETLVKGRIMPQCGLDAGTLSTHLPQRPESLTHVYRVSRKEVKVLLNWDYPKSWPVSSLSGWRVVWGKRRKTFKGSFSQTQILDKSSAITRMLPANVTSFIIRHLAEGSNFVFRVQAIAPQGAGRLAEILLSTPLRPVDPNRMRPDPTWLRPSDPTRRKKSNQNLGTKDASHRKLDEKPRGDEAVTATSAARSEKSGPPDLSSSTTNYSVLNNFDPDTMFKPSRKSAPRVDVDKNAESFDTLSPSFSPSGREFSLYIYILTLFIIGHLL